MDAFFNQSPVTNNTQGDIENVTIFHFTISPSQGEIASVTSERKIYSINGFHELTIQSTINDSDGDDAESNPKKRSKGSYLHYQQKIYTEIVHQMAHPKDNPRHIPYY